MDETIKSRSDWRPITLILAICLAAYLPTTLHYFYYDDGLLLHCARQTLETDASFPWRFSFHGHWRPLPILSSALLLRLFGANSAVPFHCFALALHSINIILASVVLSRWLPGRPKIVFAAVAMFAVHGSASEAVTYWAAVGVLWSALGGWLAACGMTNLCDDGRFSIRSSLPLAVGVLVSIGGGEYCLATVSLVLVPLFLPAKSPRSRATFVGVATIVVVFFVYCGMMAILDPRDRMGDAYCIGAHIPWRIVENVGQLLLPKGIVDKDVGLTLGVLSLVAMTAFASRRSPLIEKPATILFFAAIASLLPFAPSLLGNFPRFGYFAAPLFMTATMLALSTILQRAVADPVRAKWWAIGLVGGWMALQWTGLEMRVAQAGRRAEAVAQLMASIEAEIEENHEQQLRIWLTAPDIESIGGMLSARRLSERVAWHHSSPPIGPPQPGVTWLIVESRLRRGFRCEFRRSRAGEGGKPELSDERRSFPL